VTVSQCGRSIRVRELSEADATQILIFSENI